MNKSESKYFNTAVKMNKALIAVLETKPFEYITIKEICDRAQVNRSTFYLHYENMSDLLAETAKYLIDDFLSYFSVDTPGITIRFNDCKLSDLNFISDEYLHPYLSYIKDNSRVFLTVLMHVGSFGFENVYQRMFQYIFDPILKRFNYDEDSREYVMMFYLNGINAIVTKWLKNGCCKPIDEISDVIRDCILGKAQSYSANCISSVKAELQE